MERESLAQRIAQLIQEYANEKAKKENHSTQNVSNLPPQKKKTYCLTEEDEARTPYFVTHYQSLKDKYDLIEINKSVIDKYESENPGVYKRYEKAIDRVFPFGTALSLANIEGEKDEINIDPSETVIKSLARHRNAIRNATNKARYGWDEWRPRSCFNDLEFILFSTNRALGEDAEDSDIRRSTQMYQYRDKEVLVGNGGHNEIGIFTAAPVRDVLTKMTALLCEYEDNKTSHKLSPIEMAVKFNVEMVRIQPFLDQNKRLGMVAMNFILAENGYPSVFFDDAKQLDDYVVMMYTGIIKRDLTPLTQAVSDKILEQQRSVINYCKNEKMANVLISEGINPIENEDVVSLTPPTDPEG